MPVVWLVWFGLRFELCEEVIDEVEFFLCDHLSSPSLCEYPIDIPRNSTATYDNIKNPAL